MENQKITLLSKIVNPHTTTLLTNRTKFRKYLKLPVVPENITLEMAEKDERFNNIIAKLKAKESNIFGEFCDLVKSRINFKNIGNKLKFNKENIYLELVKQHDGYKTKFISWNSNGNCISFLDWDNLGSESFRMYLNDANNTNFLLNFNENIKSAKWNPNKEKFNEIAFITNDKYSIHIYNYEKKTLTKLNTNANTPIHEMSWSPDGCSIIASSNSCLIIMEIKEISGNEKFKEQLFINSYYNLNLLEEKNKNLCTLQLKQKNKTSPATYAFKVKYYKYNSVLIRGTYFHYSLEKVNINSNSKFEFNVVRKSLKEVETSTVYQPASFIYWTNNNIIIYYPEGKVKIKQMTTDLNTVRTFGLPFSTYVIDIIKSKTESEIKIVIGKWGRIYLFSIPLLESQNPELINKKFNVKYKNAHTNNINNIKFSPNGSLIASAGSSKIKIWNNELEQVISIYTGSDSFSSFCFHPINNYFAYFKSFEDKTKINILELFSKLESSSKFTNTYRLINNPMKSEKK